MVECSGMRRRSLGQAMGPPLSVFILVYFFCRLSTLSRGLLTPGRGLTQGFQNPEKQRVFHIHEGKYGCLLFRKPCLIWEASR